MVKFSNLWTWFFSTYLGLPIILWEISNCICNIFGYFCGHYEWYLFFLLHLIISCCWYMKPKFWQINHTWKPCWMLTSFSNFSIDSLGFLCNNHAICHNSFVLFLQIFIPICLYVVWDYIWKLAYSKGRSYVSGKKVD